MSQILNNLLKIPKWDKYEIRLIKYAHRGRLINGQPSRYLVFPVWSGSPPSPQKRGRAFPSHVDEPGPLKITAACSQTRKTSMIILDQE